MLQNMLVCPGCPPRSSQPPSVLQDSQLLEDRGSSGVRLERQVEVLQGGQATSQVRRHPSWLSRRTGSCPWSSQHHHRFHSEDQLPVDLGGLEQPPEWGGEQAGEWSEGPARGAQALTCHGRQCVTVASVFFSTLVNLLPSSCLCSWRSLPGHLLSLI